MNIILNSKNAEIVSLLVDIKAQVSTLTQMTLTTDKVSEFDQIYQKRRVEHFLDLIEAFPHLFENPVKLKSHFEEELKSL